MNKNFRCPACGSKIVNIGCLTSNPPHYDFSCGRCRFHIPSHWREKPKSDFTEEELNMFGVFASIDVIDVGNSNVKWFIQGWTKARSIPDLRDEQLEIAHTQADGFESLYTKTIEDMRLLSDSYNSLLIENARLHKVIEKSYKKYDDLRDEYIDFKHQVHPYGGF